MNKPTAEVLAVRSLMDEAIAFAVVHAAETIHLATKDHFLEKWLDDALCQGLISHFGSECVTTQKSLSGFLLPDWNPRPASADVKILHPDGSLRVVIECKVQSVDQTLWDVFKGVSACQVDGVEAAYCVVAATPKKWASSADCVALFNTPAEGHVFKSAWMFKQWPKAWRDLLNGGSGRPTSVPTHLRVQSVAKAQLAHAPDWEIRAISVQADRLHFGSDGWPVGSRMP